MNQTTQMHKIARALLAELPDCEQAFTPYYATGILELLRQWGWLNFTILGDRSRIRVLEYCREHGLPIDYQGLRGSYDLVVTCADLIIPRNIRNDRIILIQEGMTDPEGWLYKLVWHVRILPRWIASTAMMGLSGRYIRFCVASEAYRQLFIRKGAPAYRLTVTGIPNFDDCTDYLNNDFPHRDYFLVCTSDLRETFIPENRKKFILKAVGLAAGRPILFKLHPNENWERATREIKTHAPGSLIFTSGNTDHMIANCSGFLTHYSSTVYVALALGKEVHCDLNVAELMRLLPLQNRSAAKNIARVCLEVLTDAAPDTRQQTISYSFVRHPLQWARAQYRGYRAASE
jgi:hypothetical protein